MEERKKIDIWKILYDFILYSIIGFLLETIFAIITKGMFESRKSFLYGPFCSIYGIAAVCIIEFLQNKKEKPIIIFIFGMIIGVSIEYTFSFLGEYIFHARWWDYTDAIGNINGRICLFYTALWGILSLILIYIINPFFDRVLLFLKKAFSLKKIKFLITIIIVFIVIDSALTAIAVKEFVNRISNEYGIQIKNFKNTSVQNSMFERNFPNKKMIMIYPNISVITNNGEVIYLGAILKGYKNYYFNFKSFAEK